MSVKLILTQEVTGLGAAGDVVEVKNGFGRNYLVPRGLAITWSRGGEKQVEQIKRARSSRAIRDLGHAEEVRGRLEGLAVTLPVKAGAHGRLFGSITVADVADAVKVAGGVDVDKRKIELGSPIKTVGEHTVSVRLHDEVHATVTLQVVPT